MPGPAGGATQTAVWAGGGCRSPWAPWCCCGPCRTEYGAAERSPKVSARGAGGADGATTRGPPWRAGRGTAPRDVQRTRPAAERSAESSWAWANPSSAMLRRGDEYAKSEQRGAHDRSLNAVG